MGLKLKLGEKMDTKFLISSLKTNNYCSFKKDKNKIIIIRYPGSYSREDLFTVTVNGSTRLNQGSVHSMLKEARKFY